MTLNRPLIKFNNFTCSHFFNDKVLKIDSTLEVYQGESILLIGPSGGGKSTLLNIMKGLIPTFIKAKLSNEESYSLNYELGDSVLVQQNPYSSLITRSVWSEASFNLENRQIPQEKAFERIKTHAKKLKISHLFKKNRTTKGLSGGECQRLGLLNSLTTHPKLILLDEPTAFLDPESRRNFYRDLFQNTSETIVIADHHVSEVIPYVSRVWFCDENGNVKEIPKEEAHVEPISKNDLFSPHTNSFQDDFEITIPIKEENLKLCSGDILFITGINGCGKTTLLKKLAKNNLDNYAFTFQNPETHFFFESIEKEIAHECPEINYNNISDFLNIKLSDFKKSPYLLSEGEKRRLSLLLSFLKGQKIHLMDEPTFGQDRQSKILIINKMIEEQKRGVIQVIVTHDEELLKLIRDLFPSKVLHIELKGENEC